MHLSTLRKELAIAGGVGVLIALIAQGMVIGAPAMDKSPAEIQAWYVDHRALALVAVYFAAFGLTLHLTLIAVLRDRLRGAEGGAATLSGIIFPATILWMGVVMIGLGSLGLLAYRASGISAETARSLNDAAYLAFGAAGFGTALALGCVAWIVLRTGTFAAWYGWLSALVAVLHLAAAAALATSGAATPQNASLVALLYYAWVGVSIGVVARRPLAAGEVLATLERPGLSTPQTLSGTHPAG